MIPRTKLLRIRGRCACFCVVMCLLQSSSHAFAANRDVEAHADQLFQQGLELMRADHCQSAIGRFAESQRLDSSAATLVNMAICYERVGKTAAAWRTFVKAADAAVLEGNPELRSQADAALAKLDPMLTRVRIVTKAPVGAQSVRVNGEPVVDYRDPVPVDPGDTLVEAFALGRERWRVVLHTNGKGAVFEVEVPELAPLREIHLKPERRTDLRPAALVVGAAGVTGLVLGAVWAIRAKSADDSANAQGNCNDAYCNRTAHDLRDTAWERARVATWATALGATAVVGGAVLWFISPSNQEKTQVGVGPWVEPKRAAGGVLVEGRL